MYSNYLTLMMIPQSGDKIDRDYAYAETFSEDGPNAGVFKVELNECKGLL